MERPLTAKDDSSEATIRQPRQADLPDLLELFRHLSPEDPEPDPARAALAWSRLLGSDLATVFVAEHRKRLVASCTLVVLPNLTRNARSIGWIENVVTHREHRRQGLGTRLLAAALEAAWAADCYKVMLATGSGEEGTLCFYREAGFKQGGKTFFEARRP